MIYLSTTIRGLEDIAAREIESFGARVVDVLEGKVVYEGPEDLFYLLNYAAKKINRVVILLARGEVESLEDIRRIADDVDIDIGGATFGVVTERRGEHGFTSIEVSRLIGEVFLNKNPGAKVNLDDPDVPVMAWVLGSTFLLGIDTTGPSLHRRGYRVAKHPAALNPVIASAMVELSRWKDSIVDPFCGSGTILIEAYHARRRVPNVFRGFHFTRLPFFNPDVWGEIKEKYRGPRGPEPRLIGIEKNPKYIRSSLTNAEKAMVKISVVQGKAEEMHRYVSEAPYIVTNPPYGLRIGSKKEIFRLYEKFAEELEEHFSGSVFVVITPHRKFEHYFTVVEKRDILYGDLHAWIYKMKV